MFTPCCFMFYMWDLMFLYVRSRVFICEISCFYMWDLTSSLWDLMPSVWDLTLEIFASKVRFQVRFGSYMRSRVKSFYLRSHLRSHLKSHWDHGEISVRSRRDHNSFFMGYDLRHQAKLTDDSLNTSMLKNL